MSPTEIPTELIAALRNARRVVALTGAGISAESGVPTFRDALTGHWANFKPEDLATPEAFLRAPRVVWEWYASRRQNLDSVSPNPGHFALVELEKHVPGFTLVTQNVDGLHQRAGSRRVIELHGNITRTKCFNEGTPVTEWPATGDVPPRCPQCGGMLRPDVVWFGEALPVEELRTAQVATELCDLFLCIGTSALVYPAAALPFDALEAGATVVEINPHATSLTARATHALSGPSGVVLPALVKAVWG